MYGIRHRSKIVCSCVAQYDERFDLFSDEVDEVSVIERKVVSAALLVA